MSKETRVWVTLSFGVGLILARPAFAQGTAEAASTPAGPTAAIASPTQPMTALSEPLVIKPPSLRADQPTYAVDRPPEGSSGIYLPAVVLGYTRSAVGCVVVGCDDGPQVHDTSGPATKAVDAPADPRPSVPH